MSILRKLRHAEKTSYIFPTQCICLITVIKGFRKSGLLNVSTCTTKHGNISIVVPHIMKNSWRFRTVEWHDSRMYLPVIGWLMVGISSVLFASTIHVQSAGHKHMCQPLLPAGSSKAVPCICMSMWYCMYKSPPVSRRKRTSCPGSWILLVFAEQDC